MTGAHCSRPAAAVLAVLLALPFALAAPAPARAQTFPDIVNQPAEIQQAIDYVTNKGYMNGGADGNFHPSDPVGRLEYACALVKLNARTGDPVDPSITFTDLASEDPNYAMANIAVKNSYIERYADGSFRPYEPLTMAACLAGLVQGLGLADRACDAAGIWPAGPSYAGASVVAHDLHLVYRSTQVWPSASYPRGEMAFSLQAADVLEDWRTDYVEEAFVWLTCQSPLVGPVRKAAMDHAFSKIGYPYVWGGESDAEGGYDCSGLTYFVLQSVLGHPMMRTADDQSKDGRYQALAREELLPGDPIFFYKDPSSSTYVGHAGLYVGRGMFIHSTGSNAGVSVDSLQGYWSDNFACGKRVIAEPEPESFDTYFLLANPSEKASSVRLTYMLKDSRQIPLDVTLEPNSRKTVRVDDTLVNEEVSTRVEATSGQVVAERSMYFRYLDKYGGGHVSAGSTAPSPDWFLAEGCTAYGFDTYVLVQNPGGEAAQVGLKFLKEDATTAELAFVVPALARYTVAVDIVAGMEAAQFSTEVHASRPVVVERSMYFDYGGITEGHNAAGVTSLAADWYFAEGYTAGAFDTYILVANPSAATAHATLSLASDAGRLSDVYVELAPHSRRTIPVDAIQGWEQEAFSATVHSDVPVAAERAMYFDYYGMTGGHDAAGVTAPALVWFLAEGYTAGEFDTYILLQNPNRLSASVNVRFLLNGGQFVDRSYSVPALSRFTIPVDKLEGLEARELSAWISSDLPVIAERSMYFRYLGKTGGSSAAGVQGTAARWYFAEGYTGR